MSGPVTISDLRQTVRNDCNELSARVDGDPVHIRVPQSIQLHRRGEFFVGIGLLEAMFRGVPLRVEESIPLSERLAAALPEIQTVYACWNPDLSVIDIEAATTDQDPEYTMVGSFFSGGVDGSHALYRHKEGITHLVMCSGFDAGNDEASWTRRIEKETAFAHSMGIELMPVVTNARQWLEKRTIAWGFAHGLFLSSIGSNLGLKRAYVPASHTYSELFPWGTHPLTDPMWSTEGTTVIHDGAGYRRGEKMSDLCQDQRILDNLQVCWRTTTGNCGKCPKCVRVMIALHLLDASSKAFPPLRDYSSLKVLKKPDESGATFLEDGMILARDAGNKQIYRTLRHYYTRYQLSQIIPMLDRYLLRGQLRRIQYRIREPDWVRWRVPGSGSGRR